MATQSISAHLLFKAALITSMLPLPTTMMSSYQTPDFLPLFGSPRSRYPLQAATTRLASVNQFSKQNASSASTPVPAVPGLWYTIPGNSYTFNTLLAGLLDIGAPRNASDNTDSSVPPLDGRPWPVSADSYFMTSVPYDIKLVSVKNVDPLGASFTIQWQMIMQWEYVIVSESNGTTMSPNCSFICDTTNSGTLCCDTVWVPPLYIPQCNIDSIDSIVDDMPSTYWTKNNQSFDECFSAADTTCFARRFWKLNIQTTCDTEMNFENFPFDIQQLTMEILNPYSSRTWFQLVKGTLLNNGGNIINGNPPPDQKIPSWYVEDVVLSVNCRVPTWLQTFSTQDSLLKKFNSTYHSQKISIQNTLNNLKCADYRNLDVESNNNINLADIGDLSIYRMIQNDYTARFEVTLDTYRSCVESKGEEYILPSDSTLDSGKGRISDTDKLFGSWLNVSRGKPTNISFECLIQAAANLTTPIVTMSIILKRYRMFYVVKLFVPSAMCGLFTFAVVPITPKSLVERLSIVVPSALALTALQIAVTATDIPAVSYLVPTSYLVISTYGIQFLVALETIGLATWCKCKDKTRGPRRSESQPREEAVSTEINTDKEIELAARRTRQYSNDPVNQGSSSSINNQSLMDSITESNSESTQNIDSMNALGAVKPDHDVNAQGICCSSSETVADEEEVSAYEVHPSFWKRLRSHRHLQDRAWKMLIHTSDVEHDQVHSNAEPIPERENADAEGLLGLRSSNNAVDNTEVHPSCWQRFLPERWKIMRTSEVPDDRYIRRWDLGLLFLLFLVYTSALLLCFFLPYHRANQVPIAQGISIWSLN